MSPAPSAGVAPGFIGSRREGDVVRFRVYAAEHEHLDVVLFKKDGKQQLGLFPMTPTAGGYHEASFEGPTRLFYKYLVDGQGPFPDPASRSQPFGVHGPSEVVDERYAWSDAEWRGLSVEDLVIYEVHVGASSSAGTFEALATRLPELRELGITAIELMPVASFPGRRNWGYDGVSLFAPQAGYGGPLGLRRFVDAAHRHGLAVLLDVVYNHLGPDGNYLRSFSLSYFTERHKTPWGDAVNFAEPEVRSFFLHNVEMWIRDYHLDGLRLDATHAIYDDAVPAESPEPRRGSRKGVADSATAIAPILRLMGERARAAAPGRKVVVIAEDDRNERRLVTPQSKGGYGLDGVWADDFHHALRRALAGDDEGFFRDFQGTAEELSAIVRQGWFYQGQPSIHFRGPRGTRAGGIDLCRFVHCIQNHDQIGNRAHGDRLNHAIEPAAYRAASALLLVESATPLLFMGQEWSASTPFLFFTDHHAELGRAVREGRRNEFAAISALSSEIRAGNPRDELSKEPIPDPQSSQTFERSVIRWEERNREPHAGILRLYRELLRLRRAHTALQSRLREPADAIALSPDALIVRRRGGGAELYIVVNLRGSLRHTPEVNGRLLLNTENPRFGGTRADDSVYVRGEVRMEGPGAVIVELGKGGG